jgi:hypothetical protein
MATARRLSPHEAITARAEFRDRWLSGGAATSGGGTRGGGTECGHLPQQYWKFLRDADYVVFSYETPIAWHVPAAGPGDVDAWWLPDVRYSSTTDEHQAVVRLALRPAHLNTLPHIDLNPGRKQYGAYRGSPPRD